MFLCLVSLDLTTAFSHDRLRSGGRLCFRLCSTSACSNRSLSVLPAWSSSLSTHLTRRFAAKGVAARGHVYDFWRRVPSSCSILRFSEYISTSRMTRYFRRSRKFRSRGVRWNAENELFLGNVVRPYLICLAYCF